MYAKMQESGLIQMISMVCTSSVWGSCSCILTFLRVHHRKWLQSNSPSSELTGSCWRAAITDFISQVFLLGHGFDRYLGNISWSTFVPHAERQLSPCAMTTEPLCSRACLPQLQKFTKLEPVLCNKRSHCSEWEATAHRNQSVAATHCD